MTNVLVLSTNLMFAHGLKSLLGQANQSRSIEHETDFDKVVKEIKTLQPDIVIMDVSHSRLQTEAIKEVLKIKPLTIIEISLHHNRMYIYQATHKLIKNTEDLLQAVLQVEEEAILS